MGEGARLGVAHPNRLWSVSDHAHSHARDPPPPYLRGCQQRVDEHGGRVGGVQQAGRQRGGEAARIHKLGRRGEGG